MLRKPTKTSPSEQVRSELTSPAHLGGCRIHPVLAIIISVVALVLAAVASVVYGNKDIPLAEVYRTLSGEGSEYLTLVLDTRWPRTVMGAAVGAALAVSGVVIQGLTGNPLVEPGLLGVTVGASAAIVTATAFLGFTGGACAVWVALPGAVAAVPVVYILGRPARTASVIPLILSGAVVSAVLGSCIQVMVLSQPEVFDSYRNWVVGSLAGAGFEELWSVAPAMIIGLLLAWAVAPGLNALALGDDVATALGVRGGLIRAGSIAAATLLAAAATAAVGPVAFIGLAIPHLVRAMIGSDHRWMIPVAILLGAAVVLGSDVLARVLLRPQELMVGVITAFVGAPFLLLAVRRGKAGV